MELWYEVTFQAPKLRSELPPNNRPRHSRKSSFLLRHCRAKVAPSAWKHASKLTNSVDVVIACGSMRKIYRTSRCRDIDKNYRRVRMRRIISLSRCSYRRRTCFHRVKILTDSNERAHERRIMAGGYFRRGQTVEISIIPSSSWEPRFSEARIHVERTQRQNRGKRDYSLIDPQWRERERGNGDKQGI